MSRHLSVVQAAAVPAPDEVAAWLRHTGWQLRESNDRWATFEAERLGSRVVLEVPQRSSAPDYPRALGFLLRDLAALEQRTEVSLLQDIHATGFAHRRPVSRDVPRAVALSADMAPTLRSAASGLREVAVLPGIEVLGNVVVLERQDPAAGGTIQLSAMVEGRLMRVHVHLSVGDYETAVEAHRRGALVRCSGNLAREGRARVLQLPRDFSLVADEDT